LPRMNRVFNFGAGPAMLPVEILEEAQAELLNWQGMGLSILELGHRTEAFIALLDDTEQLLRSLLAIPAHYEVLFLGGSARIQFGMIPLNFLHPGETAGYLVTGLWSALAFEEAKRLMSAYCIASGEADKFQSVPPVQDWVIQDNATYLYFTPNETVHGVRTEFPAVFQGLSCIADMTSCLLTEPITITDYQLIFAGAQKNIANAGLTLVIVNKDWLARIDNTQLPLMLDYRTHVKHRSLYATPPTFNCYLAHKMFQWVQRQGGIASMYHNNVLKAGKLYDYLDASSFYDASVEKSARSLVNVCFRTRDATQEARFLQEAQQNGLFALAGHRAAGGLRASLYNAMPMQGVDALIDFMQNFAHSKDK
jgi:phosphoserine aminotransferase